MKRILLSAALVAVCWPPWSAWRRRGPERQHVAHRLLQQHELGRFSGYNPMELAHRLDWGFGSPSPAVPVDNFTGPHDHRHVLLRRDLPSFGRGRRRGRADHRRRDPPRHPRAGPVRQVVYPEHPDVAGQPPRRSALPRVHADGVRLRELDAAWEWWRHPGATGGNVPAAAALGRLGANAVRQLHALPPTEHPPGELLRLGRRLGASPNLGSIQMEPQIASWNVCAANAISTFTNANQVPHRPGRSTEEIRSGEVTENKGIYHATIEGI